MVMDVPTSITLEFDGYWREPAITGLPEGAGVYCVYACTYNDDDKPKPTVSISKLLYIGEGGEVRDRVSGHELWAEWKEHLAPGQVLCFSAALVSPETTRQRAEAALIFWHKPPVNEEYKHSFPFDTTTISVSGKTTGLTTSFTVKKDSMD